MDTLSSHPVSQQLLPHSEVLWCIKDQISWVLDSKAFLHHDKELERLCTQLIDTLNTKTIHAWYDYSDYKKRILRKKDTLEDILLQDQELNELSNRVFRLTENSPSFQQILWDRILFDW